MFWVTSALILGLAEAICFDGRGNFTVGHWPYCHDVDQGVSVYYGPSPDGEYMQLGLEIEGHKGWSALAFAGNGGMKGAQVFVVRQDAGSWVAEERYSEDYSTPVLQSSQQVELVFANENQNRLSWGILLPLTSCAGDRYPIEDRSQFMLWAAGSDHSFTYHATMRTQFHLNLMSGPEEVVDVSSLSHVDMLVHNVDVDATRVDTYVCSMFSVSELFSGYNLSEPLQLAALHPHLSSGSAKYVHHMMLFGMLGEDPSRQHGHTIEDCYEMPSASILAWGWAVGVEGTVFPAGVALPIQYGWYFLQTHYYNPSLDVGIVDNSGFRMRVVAAQRGVDVGAFLMAGGFTRQGSTIPPGQSSIAVQPFVLNRQCTSQWNSNLTIMAVAHHAHAAARNLSVEVVRAGQSLGPLRREKVYDFNHQSAEQSRIATLIPGDELIVHCTYDTSSRTNATSFGTSSSQEMCMVVFVYYPLQSVNAAFWGTDQVTKCGQTYTPNQHHDITQAETCADTGNLTSAAAQTVLRQLREGLSAPESNFARQRACVSIALIIHVTTAMQFLR